MPVDVAAVAFQLFVVCGVFSNFTDRSLIHILVLLGNSQRTPNDFAIPDQIPFN
jgi:hypothetical protein